MPERVIAYSGFTSMKSFCSSRIKADQRSISDSLRRLIFTSVLFSLLLATTSLTSLAQNDGPMSVTSVSTRSKGNRTVVSITADGSMSRAQTWQDGEGFHIVVPEAEVASEIKSGRGIRLRKIGSSIEILLQTKAEAKVKLQVVENQLNISLNSKLQSRDGEGGGVTDTEQSMREYSRSPDTPISYPTPEGVSPAYVPSQNSAVAGSSNSAGNSAGTSPTSHVEPPPAKGTIGQAGEYSNPVQGEGTEDAEEDALMSSVLLGPGVVALVLGTLAFLVSCVGRSQLVTKLSAGGSRREELGLRVDNDVDTSLETTNQQLPTTGPAREQKAEVHKPPVAAPASLFRGYRVDQRVGNLARAREYRMDVLSSRAVEDRRAIEASLIKTIRAPDSTDEERRQARGALDEYRFVARQCATLLLAPEALDRTSAARSLGEIGSPAALPFLLEALYDFESIVRNQAVVSIGELKVPSAIGALLEIATKHPDIPSNLVSRALSACSLEGLDFSDTIGVTRAFGTEEENPFLDISRLEPASSVEQLPQTSDDDGLAQALGALVSVDIQERTQAIKNIAQYSVQDSVFALSRIARQEPESSLRALAIASLATINHESVFSAVLIGMADESREVRAAAARALSRLSFNRSDAYVRMIETADEATLRSVADACIKAGIVSQNIDRLSSSDRRQAYEAFCLICLLAKTGLTQPILNAIKQHQNFRVRRNAIHLLATTGQAEVIEQLRELANDPEVAKDLRSAILDGIYKLEESKPKVEAVADEFENFAGQDTSTAAQFTCNITTEIEVDGVEM